MIAHLLHIMMLGGYLVPTWFAAYILRVTAPVSCPKGLSYQECYDGHPYHVLRHNTVYDLMIGLFWPILVMVGVIIVASKSVEGAAQITPMPKPKLGLPPDLDKAIESGEKTTDELIAAMEKLREQRQALTGKVIDPRYDTNEDEY